MGYVYLIEDIDSRTYKIGVTKSEPQRRLNKLQTGNSCKLFYKYIYECEYPYRLETMLHNHYKSCQELNEWYSLDNIDEFIKKCQEFNDIIDSLKDNPFFNKKLK